MTMSTSTQLSPWATASKHAYVILFLWGGYQATVSSPFFFKSAPVERPPWQIGIIYGGNQKPPARNEKFLWIFDFTLPKFHFILPKFYWPSPWRMKNPHRRVSDFLRREYLYSNRDCRLLQ